VGLLLRTFLRRPPAGCGGLAGILARSLHFAVAVTDGSRIENINKIGVRLWTDRPEPPPKHRIKIAWTRAGLL